MKKSKSKSNEKEESPEQVAADEAVDRMRDFVDRKDEFVNAVKTDKDRRVSTRKKG